MTEKDKTYYDKAYQERPDYKEHYECSYYIFVWRAVLDLLKEYDKPKIMELGCGTGQFAHFLLDNNYTNYYGIDFSETAIKIAKEMSDQDFAVKDIYEIYDIDCLEYDIIMMLEILEHLNNDIKLLGNLPRSCDIIFSVPKFDDPAHVRFFHSVDEVKERYNFFNFKQIHEWDKFILCKGRLK